MSKCGNTRNDKRIIKAVVKVNMENRIIDKHLITGILDSIYQTRKHS